MAMDEQQFLTRIAEVVEVDAASISMSSPLGDLQNWDSLSRVGFLALLDQHYGKTVEPDDLDQAKVVGDLWILASRSD
jgi:acyl carrier protein